MSENRKTQLKGIVRTVWSTAAAMSAENVNKMLSFCTDDLVMNWPFGPPARCEGKQACREFLTANIVEFDELVLEELFCDDDQDVVVLTGHSQGRNPQSGKPYSNRYVLIFHFRGDLICKWEEYLNPIAVMEAAG